MKILRDFLDAYRERTEVLRETLELSRNLSLPPGSELGSEDDAEEEEPSPWTDWCESFGADLDEDDFEEVVWAREQLERPDSPATQGEARTILTNHAVPKPAWRDA